MTELCDLRIHINAQQTFFLNQKIITAYSGKLKKIIKQEKRKTQIKNSGIEIDDFPGGPDGFELVSRFCYSKGRIKITVSNVCLLHSSAIFLGMTEKVTACNLLHQTETFLEGMFYWSWNDLLVCLKSCEPFFLYAESSGLVQKLICSLLAKIAQNSDINLIASSSSSSSSPETTSGFRFSSSTKTTPELLKPSSLNKAWWFEDLAFLSPKIIEKFIKSLGAYGIDNNSLVLTKFLLHYLKTAVQKKEKKKTTHNENFKSEYGGLADTAVYGVILMGKTAFSCRGLFWVLRIVSCFGLSRECRIGLEKLIGEMLDQATLDDLLVSGHDGRGVYDVNLVIRLIRVFVNDDGVCVQKMKKVGKLIDKYLGEISPDQNLKISKFLAVAKSLPDSARDSYDGVYRAVDIYLESHSTFSFEEASRLCRCLNYEKLSLETCKDLAKNPRIPPRVAVQALSSQQSNLPTKELLLSDQSPISTSDTHLVLYNNGVGEDSLCEENEDMRLNLQRMQWRVVELEKVCKEMRGQMSRLVKNKVGGSPNHARALPRLC
ncbi:NPH3 domain [Dillenia turbinata]|uniref:NPH3 domain n=1 Tax=Dillenia turbinata TaxID=194707 RepID=A0AAN8UQQ5_9MAGN